MNLQREQLETLAKRFSKTRPVVAGGFVDDLVAFAQLVLSETASAPPQGWQPIATAPKRKHDVLDLWCVGEHDDVAFYCPDYCAVGGERGYVNGQHLYQGRVCNVHWSGDAWRPKSGLRLHALTVTPTHWVRPLPSPPSAPTPQEKP